MKRFNGGSKVPGGYYWNPARWDIASISGAEGVLDGDSAEQFIRVPLLVMIPVAAIVSFGFVVFLPFIGFALFAYVVGKKVAALASGVAKQAAISVTPGLVPGEAHLSGKPVDDKTKEESPRAADEASEELAKLTKEIDERRRNQK